MEKEIDLKEFREHLQLMEKELIAATQSDENYDGEVDEVLASLRRLTKAVKDPAHAKVVFDLFVVMEFFNMLDGIFSDLDDEDLDDEDLDDEDLDDEDLDDVDIDDEDLEFEEEDEEDNKPKKR